MEQLTAIVFDDPKTNTCVGYRDLTHDEFWVSGHMPGSPLMPGVMMCEAAAQVCTYHSHRHDLLGCELMGFGGLDEVRFRGIVVPGNRLVLACRVIGVRRNRMITFEFQGFVDTRLICEGQIRGVPLSAEDIRNAQV